MFYRLHHVISPSHAFYSYTHDLAFKCLFLIWIYLYTHTHTYLCTPLSIHLNICWGVSDSPELACSGSEGSIEAEPSTEDQAYPSAQAD